MLKPISLLLHSFLLLVLIGSLSSMVYYINHDPVAAPAQVLAAGFTPSPVSPPPTNAAATLAPVLVNPSPLPRLTESAPGENWALLRPGLERRVIDIYNSQSQLVESLYVWRLDQKRFRLDVAYDDAPQSLDAWQKETNALMVVNGGYYSIRNETYYYPDGLTIVGGKAAGRSFSGFGGMLAITEQQADLQWLVQEPYDPAQSLQSALQSFPILVQPGGELGFGAERENNVRARRTVIAQDTQGRILFLVAPLGYFTLHQLSAYLTESDLDLDIALNLDGGGSTGILVAEPRELIAPTRPIPFVILVHPR